MRRAFLFGVAVAVVSIVTGSQNADGAWFFGRRRRSRLPCMPPTEDQKPVRARTVEELATLLVELKGKIDVFVPSDAREEMDLTLNDIMGNSNAIVQALGPKVVGERQRVNRSEIERLFGGEVLALSEELRRLSSGQ